MVVVGAAVVALRKSWSVLDRKRLAPMKEPSPVQNSPCCTAAICWLTRLLGRAVAGSPSMPFTRKTGPSQLGAVMASATALRASWGSVLVSLWLSWVVIASSEAVGCWPVAGVTSRLETRNPSPGTWALNLMALSLRGSGATVR